MVTGFYSGQGPVINGPNNLSDVAFSMVVENRGGGANESGIQRLTAAGNPGRQWIRNFSVRNFSEWIEQPTQAGNTVFNMSVTRANQLVTPRQFSLSGTITGTESFDGSANVTINTKQRVVEITDWNAFDPQALGLELGESVAVTAADNDFNAPYTSMSGSVQRVGRPTNNRGYSLHLRRHNASDEQQSVFFIRQYDPDLGGWQRWRAMVDREGTIRTANRLATARTINSVAFDGSQDITLTANPTLTSIPANTDLNDFYRMGFYQGQQGGSLTNSPNGLGNQFTMVVEQRGTGSISGVQRITANTGRRWFRNFSNGVFSEWIEEPTQLGNTVFDMSVARANQLLPMQVTNWNDLESIWNTMDDGEVRVLRANDADNGPSTRDAHGMLFKYDTQLGGNGLVIAFDYPNLFIRQFGAGQWSSWRSLVHDETQSNEIVEMKKEIEELRALITKLMI